MLVPTLLVTGFAFLFAPEVRGADLDVSMNATIRGFVAMFWFFAVFMLAQRTTAAHSEPVAESFALTTVSARTAVVGGIIAESLRVFSYALPIGLLGTLGTAYAFNSVVSLLLIPLIGGLYVVSAVVAGRVVGYVAAWLVARVPFFARHETALGVIIVALFFGVYFLFQMPMLPISLSTALLGVVPLGWVADLLVIGTPIEWSVTYATGGLIAAVAVVVGGGWFAERIATSLWFDEPVDVSTDSDERKSVRAEGRGALAGAISPLGVPVVTGPTRTVAEWALLRARREPQRLNFLLIPVFGIGSAVVNLVLQGDGSVAVVGPAVAVAGGWIASAAFGLNPLGDEGSVLPITLTTVSGRAFVRGLITPSLLFLPVVATVTLGAAIGGGYAWLPAVGVALASCFLSIVGAVVAPLIGMRFPRFSAIRIGNSDEVRPPGLLAGILHVLLVWVPGVALVGLIAAPQLVQLAVSGAGYVPGFAISLVASGGGLADLAELLSDGGAAIQAIPLATFRLGFGGLLIGGGVLVAWSAYRRAVHQFDAYEPY
ncbi:hypothetical protein K933_02251 [Candidatus Halobonum tyrrellensis G22]|uniref:Uncharacterized protein n=1 Tax=Candidatus Halobonum tyrrellensis G22 TaxID=1324957 RepID=V4J2Z3_9EURY|nr:hypothetical protein K933_02251 [Candidatus Halobonum tyrrellensis G22]